MQKCSFASCTNKLCETGEIKYKEACLFLQVETSEPLLEPVWKQKVVCIDGKQRKLPTEVKLYLINGEKEDIKQNRNIVEAEGPANKIKTA